MQFPDRHQLAGNGPMRAVVGFDGFVDEIVYVVDKRYGPDRYDRLRTLREYGQRIAAASGLSTNVEIVPAWRKLGGNGPIFALGLKKYQAQITYIGCIGESTIDPVFAELAEGSRMIGICDPGQTDAMEFEDGKLIRSKLDSLNQMNWENLTAKLPAGELARLLDEAELFSFNNWTMLPHMSRLWQRILEDVLPLMKTPFQSKTVFFDLADPEKRAAEDIRQGLELIRRFARAGFRTALGLNKKEACEIAAIAGGTFDLRQDDNLRSLTECLAGLMQIDCVAVHPTDRAACVYQGRYSEVSGPYCASPQLTTGAGDSFNAGFVHGLVNGLNGEDCLLLAVATSGYYVRNGKSPTLDQVIAFARLWKEGKLEALETTKE